MLKNITNITIQSITKDVLINADIFPYGMYILLLNSITIPLWKNNNVKNLPK